jgi:hypothetical protein
MHVVLFALVKGKGEGEGQGVRTGLHALLRLEMDFREDIFFMVGFVWGIGAMKWDEGVGGEGL